MKLDQTKVYIENELNLDKYNHAFTPLSALFLCAELGVIKTTYCASVVVSLISS